MRALVTPEQTCAYLSMLAAEQRLKVSSFSHFQPSDRFMENKVTLNDANAIMGNNARLMWPTGCAKINYAVLTGHDKSYTGPFLENS